MTAFDELPPAISPPRFIDEVDIQTLDDLAKMDDLRDWDEPGTPTETPDELWQRLGRVTFDAEFWAGGDSAEDWAYEPIVPRGRGVSIYAGGGVGKSLLIQWISVTAATGKGGLTEGERIKVLYADYEMTTADLRERLTSMGFGPDDDLSWLTYLSLPSIDPLDTRPGGQSLLTAALDAKADLVVIDTISRAVATAAENDSAGVLAYYRHCAAPLKAAGIAVLRIDHAGYDGTHARGSSAKRDDVDLVWRLSAKDGGHFTLTADKRRLPWVPETVELLQLTDPVLSYRLVGGGGWPAGTAEVAALMDRLALPVDISVRDAQLALRNANQGRRTDLVRAAIKHRKSSVPIASKA